MGEGEGRAVGMLREKVAGSDIEMALGSRSDVPPLAELVRLQTSFAALFPRSQGPAIVVLLEWFSNRKVWKIRGAAQRVGQAAFVERSRDVAEALAAAGHDVEVRKNPMDSPPAGIPIPRPRD